MTANFQEGVHPIIWCCGAWEHDFIQRVIMPKAVHASETNKKGLQNEVPYWFQDRMPLQLPTVWKLERSATFEREHWRACCVVSFQGCIAPGSQLFLDNYFKFKNSWRTSLMMAPSHVGLSEPTKKTFRMTSKRQSEQRKAHLEKQAWCDNIFIEGY